MGIWHDARRRVPWGPWLVVPSGCNDQANAELTSLPKVAAARSPWVLVYRFISVDERTWTGPNRHGMTYRHKWRPVMQRVEQPVKLSATVDDKGRQSRRGRCRGP